MYFPRFVTRLILHLLQTIVRLVQTALSYILMLMVMNNFAGFFLSAIIGRRDHRRSID